MIGRPGRRPGAALAAALALPACVATAAPAADDPPAAALPDSAGAEAVDTATPEPSWRPSPVADALATFRLERSVDVDVVTFGDPDDPVPPPGGLTLADFLRVLPGVRTRELSQGPTVESFGLEGTGSGRSDLRLDGGSLVTPGTSGPHAHEMVLSEIRGLRVLRGGAGALYGPEAAAGAVVVDRAFPVADELTTRAVAEEGVDGYQRGAFRLARRLGSQGAFFLTTESRRTDGFFPGTKEVDRHFAGQARRALPGGWEAQASYRRWEGDGRSGGFVPDLPVRSAVTKRGDWRARVFRPGPSEGRGTLLEVGLLRERLEGLGGGEPDRTREIVVPSARITADVPSPHGFAAVARVEAARWRVEEEEAGTVDRVWRGAGALRVSTLGHGDGRATATVRADAEQDRRSARHARLEGALTPGSWTVFGSASRGERIPPRGAAGRANEVTNQARAGAGWGRGAFRISLAGWATRIHDFRRDPTFAEIEARAPVLDAPIGTAEIVGASLELASGPFTLPGLAPLGTLDLRTSVARQRAELAGGGDLPGRPGRTWTGEGTIERRFFADELLARVRGRLTYWGDRGGVDIFGEPPGDLWLTDVQLEGTIGDAVFFYRFSDLLERADSVEPGYRWPGFSRMYGISWVFRG